MTAGHRSLVGFWVGGLSGQSGPPASVRSVIGFWVGGLSKDPSTPPPTVSGTGGTYPVKWNVQRLSPADDADTALQRQDEAVKALAKAAKDRKTQKAIKRLASFASMAAQKGVVSVPPVVANDAALTDAQIQRIAEGVLQALTEAYIEIEDEELLLMYASL